MTDSSDGSPVVTKTGVLGYVLGSIKSAFHAGGGKPRVVPSEHLRIDYGNMIGDGTYGEVYEGDIVGGEMMGTHIVAKRAKDFAENLQQMENGESELPPGDQENALLAYKYLEIEAFMNDLVMQTCPQAAAPYLGVSMVKGTRWLVWQHVGAGTLEEILIECDKKGSLKPLAESIRLKNFVDGDVRSLSRLVNRLAKQLLSCCLALENNGIAHRDVKPYNLLCVDGEMVLIDFGSSAAMGDEERTGYDWHKSPCDPRYAPPEQFIDEVEWAKYDLYCVGLILVRVLFPPLWCGEFFDEFADTYHEANYDLDFWLKRLIMADDELAKQMRTQSEMDGQYVELAKESCALHPEGARLNMCSIQEGLEVLNLKGRGICWDTLRSMLALEPAHRLSTKKILNRIEEANSVWYAGEE